MATDGYRKCPNGLMYDLMDVPRFGAPHEAQHGASMLRASSTSFSTAYRHSLRQVFSDTIWLSWLFMMFQTRGANPGADRKSMALES